VVCLVIGMLLGFQTIKRSRDWKDDLSLSRSIVVKEPSYAPGHFDYGYAAYQNGDGQTAAAEFKIAVEIDPRFALASWAYYYLGALHADAGDFSTATRYFRSSVKAEPLNAKSHYALATLLAASDKKSSMAEYHQFLNTMHALSLSSVHHLPEVNSVLLLGSVHRAGEQGQGSGSHRALWKLFHHFPTGTDLYYDEAHLTIRGKLLAANTVMHLAEIDRRSYASRFIRYPLQTAQEALFMYDVYCRQHLYMPTMMEFRDKNNNILSKTYMQKEAEEFFEYAPRGTVMRSFIDTVCAVQGE
jgi:tetratricopeptide (TPR) repeat protein